MKSVVGFTLSLALLGFSPQLLAHPDYHQLPPGLQKKVVQGRPLPAAWHKRSHKKQYLSPQHYARAHRRHDRGDYELVYIEDKIYRVIKNTREIVEILGI